MLFRSEEFSAVARDYCDITWAKALDAAGVPADSNLRRPESIYYDSNIQELPSSDSPPPEQPAPVSEVPITNQALPAPVEFSTDSHQDAGQGKKVEATQDKASAEAGLKTTERQAESLRKELHYCEINLETEKQAVKELHE